jgi:hypothetical protein
MLCVLASSCAANLQVLEERTRVNRNELHLLVNILLDLLDVHS